MARVFLMFLDVLTHKHVTTMIQQIPMMARVFMLKLIMIVTESAQMTQMVMECVMSLKFWDVQMKMHLILILLQPRTMAPVLRLLVVVQIQ